MGNNSKDISPYLIFVENLPKEGGQFSRGEKCPCDSHYWATQGICSADPSRRLDIELYYPGRFQVHNLMAICQVPAKYKVLLLGIETIKKP